MRRNMDDTTVALILQSKGSAVEIAERVGVSDSTVYIIKRLRSKAAERVASMLTERGIAFETWDDPRPRNTLSAETVEEIKNSKKKSNVLAKEFGISASMVRMIRTGRSYR